MSETRDDARQGDGGGHDLALSVRGARLARDVGATTVGELARFTADELLSAKCFGETSLREINEALARRGLRLGMTPAELRGRPGLGARIVFQQRPGPVEAAAGAGHDGPCCGDCKDTAGRLRQRTELERKLAMSLAELELSVRITNCLEREGITTVADLVIRSAEELQKIPGFAPAALRDVTARLARHGLRLGMALPARGSP
jgi:DNA-directed RNA polymerase alpha subunit